MITITVVSYNATPLAQPLAAHFDEMGGNIGRADNNQLVLPDPERTISRVHAQVVFRGGRYAIVDRGSNPISINGRPLGNGQEAPLQPGDEVQVGGYTMRIEASGPSGGAAVVDPFADFGGLAAAPARPGARAAAPPASPASLDPLAGFGLAPSAPAPSYAAPAPAPAAAGGIPDDWDPFAPDPVAKPRGDDFARSLGQAPAGGGFGMEVGGRSSAPLIPGMSGGNAGAGGADSIDNLFGLGASSGADPFANSVLGQAAAQPNMAANADPLKSLNSVTRASASAAADTRSELNTPFTLPTAAPSRPSAAPAPAPMAPPNVPAAPAAAKGAVLSWDEGTSENRTIIRPKASAAPVAAPKPAALPAAAPMPIAAPAVRPAPVPVPAAVAPAEALDLLFDFDAPAPAPASRAAVPPPAAERAAPPAAPNAMGAPGAPGAPAAPRQDAGNDAALLAALKAGLGVRGLQIDSLTPELMRLLGQIVHEATRGTVELLVARAALKREIRAEVTMIVARENNPLKFSPSVDVALNHLLNPPVRGFMPSDEAMRDAYDDLRAHQFGFLAGMRAALEGVLRRFDPKELEGKLTQRSMLSTLLPGSRKARMWDVFNELYGQISSEAEDDFHELFGKEFLRAYEAHIADLAKDRS